MLRAGNVAVLFTWLAAVPTTATLTPRQSYTCGQNTTFTANAGLEFNVYPCTRNYGVGTNIYEADVANITECFDTCVHLGTGEKPCVAIVYNIAERHCWFLDDTLNSTSQLSSDDTLHTALVSDFSAFQNLNDVCPYTNLTTQSTLNGLDFEILCNTNIGANIDPWLTNTTTSVDLHAPTFDACMTYCSTMTPKCYGVTYEPALPHGYKNCFPKGRDADAAIVTSATASALFPSNTSHVALALFAPNINTTCSTSSNYTAPTNATTFSMSCDVAATGQNLTSLYTPNFGTCMDECAAYVASPSSSISASSPSSSTPTPSPGAAESQTNTYTNTTTPCVAALYQPSGDDGYENCYLKASVQSSGPRSEWRLALRLDGAGETVGGIANETGTAAEGSGESGGDGGGSKAWIAGPVVGAVVVGVVAMAGWLFWRRRRRARDSKGYRAGGGAGDGAATAADGDADGEILDGEGTPVWHKGQKGNGNVNGSGNSNTNAELDATFTERKELGSGQPLMAMMRPDGAERTRQAERVELEGSEGRWRDGERRM